MSDDPFELTGTAHDNRLIEMYRDLQAEGEDPTAIPWTDVPRSYVDEVLADESFAGVMIRYGLAKAFEDIEIKFGDLP